MAILNNLIVNGTARFLNTVYADDIDISGDLAAATITSSGALKGASLYLNNTLAMDVNSSTLRINSASAFSNGVSFGNSKIAASGTVNLTGTTTATTLNTTTIKNSGNIYNTNGRVETDEIRSNVWDIVSTQNLGGDFFVAPTIMIKDGSTFTITAVSGTTITGSIKDTTNITSANFGGHTWSQNSKIKITGKLTSGSNTYILGTCDGTLSANMNSTANTITFSITCNASTVPPTGTYTISDGTVMMYNVGGSNKVGIYMTCYGTDKYTYIDVYNGSNGDKPVARLGKLDGLDKVNNVSPTAYGIYTTNGYYQGIVVANGGVIGGYTIGTSALYSGSHSAYNTNEDGIFMDATWLAGGKQAAWYLKSDGSAKIGALTLTSAGVLSVPAANITDLSTSVVSAVTANFTTLSAITADMGTITAGVIKHDTVGGTNGIWISAATNTASNVTVGNSGARKDWRLLVNNKFGVTTAGGLYASSADITGKIQADSGYISGSVTIGSGGSSITNTLAAKASVDAEYSVDIVTSNFNPGATSGNLVTLTAKVTRTNGGTIAGISYQWFGDGTSLGAASTSASSYNVPYNTTYKTFTVEIS